MTKHDSEHRPCRTLSEKSLTNNGTSTNHQLCGNGRMGLPALLRAIKNVEFAMKIVILEKKQERLRGKTLTEKVPVEAQALRQSDKNSTQAV